MHRVHFNQISRAFRTIGCANDYLWRVLGDATYSEIGSPTSHATSIDTIIEAVLVTDGDDTYSQDRSSRRSYGAFSLHVGPDTRSEITDGSGTLLGYGRKPLAGDEIYMGGADAPLLVTDEATPSAYIESDAVITTITMQYLDTGVLVTRILASPGDYTYSIDTGTIAFHIAIPSGATVTASYWYDKYYIEEVMNYGETYIELALNKVSKS